MDVNKRGITIVQALIIGLKLYDRREENGYGLLRSITIGLQYRTILNFLYQAGTTPSQLRQMLEEAQTETVCPQMFE